MAGGSGGGKGLVVAAVLAAGVFAAAGWFLLGSGPAAPPSATPSRDGSGPASAAAPTEAAPVAAPEAPAAATPAGRGVVLGRLVRGAPPAPIAGTVRVSGPGITAREVEAGPDGRFRIEGFARGSLFSLTAQAGECVPSTWSNLRFPAASPMDLGDMVLGPGTTVEVSVRDAADRPIAGAAVSLHRNYYYPRETDWVLAQLQRLQEPLVQASAVTDAAGKARIEGVPPGAWSVLGEAKGFAPAWGGVTVTEGATPGIVNILLQAGVRLEGTVATHDGKPAPGILVECRSLGGPWGGGPTPPSATSDAEGRWTLENLPPGETWITVRPRPDLKIQVGSVRLPGVPRYDIRLPEGGEVRGTVVDDAGGQPIPGASVTIQMWDAQGGAGQAYAGGLTDAAGAFSLTGLPDLAVGQVSVSADGYRGWPDGNAAVPNQQTSLAPGSVREVSVRLRRGAAVVGRVADRAGTPVPQAQVLLYGWTDNRGTVTSGCVRTDAEGNYRIENAPEGKVLVSVVAEGYRQPDWNPNYWEVFQKKEFPESCSVDVPAEGEARRDLVLAPGGTVEGIVTGPDGAPAAGISVVVASATAGFGGSAAPTDAEGRFRLVGTPFGENLTVTASGAAGVRGTSEPFRLEEGGTASGIRISLQGGCTLAGRVRRTDGAAPEGVLLRLVDSVPDPNQPWDWTWRRQSALPRAVALDGAFRFEGLVPGKYTVIVSSTGTCEAEVVVGEIAAGAVKDDVDIALVPGGAVAGRVTDPSGNPLAGAMVSAVKRPVGSRMVWQGENTPVDALTGADGAFRISGIAEGVHDVKASLPGRVPGSVAATAGKEDLVLVLREGGVVAGVVVDEATGAPLADLPVTAQALKPVTGPVRNPVATTGKDGTFRLDELDPDCAYNVTAGVQWGQSPSDHSPRTLKEVKVGTTDLRIALPTGLAISGRLVDASGAALQGNFSVQAVGVGADGNPDWSKNRWAQISTNDGNFRLGGLDPGNYNLTISGSGSGALAPVTRSAVAAGTTGLVVTMGRGVVVKGRVVDENGATLTGKQAWVQYGPSGQNPNGGARLEEDGTFTTTPLDPTGSYDFRVGGVEGSMGAFLRGVVPGDGEVVLRLQQGGTISGRVVDGNGVPAKGAVVMATAEGADGRLPGGRAGAGVGEDGAFTLKGLGDFKFRITVGGNNTPWKPTSLAETVAPGATGLVLTVQPGVSLSGRLTDSTGQGVVRANLRAVPEGASPDDNGTWTRTADDGAFVFKGLAEGRYRITAWIQNGTGWVELGTAEAPGEGLALSLPE